MRPACRSNCAWPYKNRPHRAKPTRRRPTRGTARAGWRFPKAYSARPAPLAAKIARASLRRPAVRPATRQCFGRAAAVCASVAARPFGATGRFSAPNPHFCRATPPTANAAVQAAFAGSGTGSHPPNANAEVRAGTAHRVIRRHGAASRKRRGMRQSAGVGRCRVRQIGRAPRRVPARPPLCPLQTA